MLGVVCSGEGDGLWVVVLVVVAVLPTMFLPLSEVGWGVAASR